MAINKNIWLEAGKDGVFTYSKTLDQLVKAGTLKFNTPFDRSLALWKRDKLKASTYMIKNSEPSLVAEFEASGEVVLSYGYTNFSNKYGMAPPVDFLNSFAHEDSNVLAWSPGQRSRQQGYLNAYKNDAIIIDFPYKAYAFAVYIIAAQSTAIDAATVNVTCDEYFNTHKNNYPFIRCVYGVPYWSTNGTSNRSVPHNYYNVMPYSYGTYKILDYAGYSQTFQTAPTYGGRVSQKIPILGTFNYYSPSATLEVPNLTAGGSTNMTELARFAYYPELAEISYNITNPEAKYQYLAFNYQLTKEQVIQYALKWGFIIGTSVAGAQDITCQNASTYVPKINSFGSVTDDYTSGPGNADNPALNWTNPWDDSGYDFTDPNQYVDSIGLNTPSLTTTGIFNRTFALTGSDVNRLADYLWNADETIFNEIVKGLSLMGGNPIDGLIDLRLYPFDIVSKSGGSGGAGNIVVGRTDTGVSGVIINNYNAIIDLGSCVFTQKFKNFLDYEPYTTASLYIPYVGIVPIPTAQFSGQNVSCKLIVDITTGACTAVVFCNNIPMIYKNGSIGIDIPMTATNSSNYAGRIIGGLTSGTVDVAMGAATGNPSSVISGLGEITNAAMGINNTMYNTAGSSSPSCSLWQPQNCYFVIQKPVPIVPDNYGHNIGFACNYQATLSSLSGFTCCYNPDVSTIAATEEEKQELEQFLKAGIYL